MVSKFVRIETYMLEKHFYNFFNSKLELQSDTRLRF